LEDPDGEHHLYWTKPPKNVIIAIKSPSMNLPLALKSPSMSPFFVHPQILVIKKFKDLSVTRKFKELTRWLVEVCMLQTSYFPAEHVSCVSRKDICL
jgi:hypothetical protein